VPGLVTGLYAGLLGLLVLVLMVRVVRLRWKFRVGVGDGNERTLLKAIRVHGNAVEHIPIALVLLLVAELDKATPGFLHAAGGALVIARIFHAIGLSRTAGPSWPRAIGVVGTVGVIAVLAIYDIQAFFR